MSDRYDYGPLQTWQVIWKSGHIEEIHGHQIIIDSTTPGLFSPIAVATVEREPRVKIHGEINGRWMLVLLALESDILSIRLMVGDRVVDGAL